MSDLNSKLQKTIGHQLSTEGMELVDFVSIPKSADRMIRFRTMQEVLGDFDSLSEDGSTETFVVYVRRKQTAVVSQNPTREPVSVDGIYLPNGKLNTEYLLDNAKLLFSASEYTSAKNIYQTLVNAREKIDQALFGLARCHEAEAQLEDAAKYYEESILYNPKLETYRRYAALLIRTKKDQQAAEVLERALGLRDLPDAVRFELHHACGNSLLRTGNLLKVERHYKSALLLKPSAEEISTNLGVLYLQQSKTTPAIEVFQNAIRANPQNDKALSGLATAYLTQGHLRQAHDFFAQSLRVNLNNPKAIFHLVKCAYQIKRFEEACELLGEYIQVAPFNANLLYSLAGLQYHLGQKTEARRTVQQILSIQPNHAETRNLEILLNQQ